MTVVYLFATHTRNVDRSLACELTRLGGEIHEDESCSSKTVFSMEIGENVEKLLLLRCLRYADEIYLQIYHNRMHPSKDHPDCPVELRGYLSLLFYGINYVPEISRCIDLLDKLVGNFDTVAGEPVRIHFNIFTSEISPTWKQGLEIVRRELPRHINYALNENHLNWSISCYNTVFKNEDGINVMIFADRHDIYAGVLLYDEEIFRPYLTFWQLSGAVAATVVELAEIHDGDIVLDMACDCGELTLEVLRNYDCFCIAMSPKIDQLAMAEVNWVGLQNHLKKEAGSRARHLQFIAAEFNKDFFNFNVVNKILCSLPLRWWKENSETLDLYYDKLFTIISKCRQETHSVLLIPLTKDHKQRVNLASTSNKYNFQVLIMRRLITRSTQMYVCLLETKLPRLAFPERSRGVDFLMSQDSLLSHTLDLSVPQSPLIRTSHSLNLAPVSDHFIHNSLCLPMLQPTTSLDLPIQHTNFLSGHDCTNFCPKRQPRMIDRLRA
ncbi:hypothetical protein RB195_012870 [Necator americanus]|uniref:Uncharacterized protein n=1 Tax=Necator americanus TaxID=51031 RepID=A0ABR1DT60_NECAM